MAFAFTFTLGFGLAVSIWAGKMVSIQNTRCREDILQAQLMSISQIVIYIEGEMSVGTCIFQHII